MTRICLDTNVIISAEVFGGKCQEITDLISFSKLDLIISLYILNEVAKVLRDRFEYPDEEVRRTMRVLLALGTLVSSGQKVNILSYEPDNRVIECALAGKVDYLVTGDKKHILNLKEYEGIKILSPGEFLKVIASEK